MDINEIKDIKTKELVQKYNFRFSKSLGQNFLIDDSVPRDIVNGADVCEDDLVIEIGPGVGTLTVQLLKRAKRVVAIELDSSLIPILTAELGDNPKFQLIHNDALKVDFNEIIGDEKSVKLVANLPYYVTTPIIVNLLKGGYNFKSLTIMIQKEVAERMNAEPNCKDYGALSILVQYYCNTKIVRKVPPSCNATKNVKLPKELMEKAYEEAGIDPKRRGETLSLAEFGALSDAIDKYMNN